MSETELSRKEANISRVVRVALTKFVKDGIEGSKVSDIARIAHLTERSIFRYFETKSDLVLASGLLFWQEVKTFVSKNIHNPNDSPNKGIDDIEEILNKYTSVYFNYYKQLIFVSEAESYLYRCGKDLISKTNVLTSYESSPDPLALAIQKGLKDGSVRNDINVEDTYLNTYDSLLGLLQKLALKKKENAKESDTQRVKDRLKEFCHVLVMGFKK